MKPRVYVETSVISYLAARPSVEYLLRKKAIPAKAFTDAVHIAIAALHEVQFIASWNFRHIVGAVARTLKLIKLIA